MNYTLLNDSRFKNLQNIFEKHFILNGFTHGDKFNSDIWFLANFSSKTKRSNDKSNSHSHSHSQRSDSDDHMRVIISSLINTNPLNKQESLFDFSPSKNKREKKNDCDINDLTTFKIYVSDFINKICEVLLYSQSIIEKCKENEEMNNGKRKRDKINKTLSSINKDLKNKKDLEELDNNIIISDSKLKKSTLSISISKLFNIPTGNYSFKVIFKEFDPDLYIQIFEKKIKTALNFTSFCSEVALFEKFKKNEFAFTEIYLSPLNQQKLLDYINENNVIKLKTIIYKNDSASKKDFIDSAKTKDFRKMNTMSSKNNKFSTSSINTITFDKDLHDSYMFNSSETNIQTYSPMKFRSEHNVGYGKTNQFCQFIPTDFKFEENCGINLISFTLSIERNGEYFAESEESFLDYAVLFSEELCENNYINPHGRIATPFHCQLNVDKQIQARLNYYEKCSALLNLDIFLNSETKVAILERVSRLFDENQMLREYHENLINSLLESYFIEVANKVKNVLKENKEVKETCCQDNCITF